MLRVISVVILTMLTGCAAYKIVPQQNAQGIITEYEKATVKISKVNELPEGFHCMEPMLYIITIGLFPTHCVDRYEVIVGLDKKPKGDVKVVSMQGWIPLLFVPLPSWRYGNIPRNDEEMLDALYEQ